MKSLIAILGLALSLGAVESVHADTHHQLIIHATLRALVVSGTVTSTVTTPITNATLIKAIVGLNTGITTKDLDIAIDDTTAEIDVINKTQSPPTVVYVIGQADQNTDTDAQLDSNKRKSLVGYEVISRYLINIPEETGTAITDLYLKLPVLAADPDGEFASVRTTFFGGYNAGNDSFIIQGAASTTSKPYTY